jgi:pimeloyl-ACP methyl ester carboxylesterase
MGAVVTERITSLDRDGLTFDVFDEGPLDGEVVVLLHGFPERSTTWRYVAPLLHERGYRTVAMDQRGFSPGARPKRRRDYRMVTLADDAAALINKVGGPVHLVGHDWGAVVGWTVAMLGPELLCSYTAISVAHPMAFLEALVSSSQIRKSWYIAGFQLPLVAERMAAKPGGRFDRGLLNSGMTEEEVQRFRREIVDDGVLPHALKWYRAIALVDRRMPPNRKVRVPTTLIWSDGDVALARRGAERTGRHVDAPYELVVLEGVSHWIPTQEPEACAEAIAKRAAA